MADSPTLTITNRTLARLSKIAEGNGIDPNKIELMESHEDTYVIDAQIRLTPHFNFQTKQYGGPVKSKSAKILSSPAELQEEVNRQRESYNSSKEWLEDALKEIRDAEGHGWGQDKARIALPGSKATLAANEKCPACQGSKKMTCTQCQGRAVIICPHCEGRGQEQCYHCYMQGFEPSNPQQQCSICRGTKWAECRYCQRRMQLPCPTCQGRGGTPCAQCKGAGSFTHEVSVEGGAEMHFDVHPNRSLPSGLLRGLDRLGMINLPKGHADIELIEPDKDSPENEKNIVRLKAKVPYADIKIRLNSRPVNFAAFGKKGLLMGLPAFLDESLRPWREHLVRAVMGNGDLDKAITVRVMHDALGLELSGKSNPNDLRRLYPIGLSPKTAQEIMNNMGLALKRFTLRSRIGVAIVSMLGSTALFGGYFLTSMHDQLAGSISAKALLMLDAFLPVIAMGISSVAFSHASRWALQRQFPDATIRLTQKIGKIGYGTLAGIVAIYAAILTLSRLN